MKNFLFLMSLNIININGTNLSTSQNSYFSQQLIEIKNQLKTI